MPEIKPGQRYKHYKNKIYQIIGFAHHADDDVKMVVYKPLHVVPELVEEYGDALVFTRPYTAFTDSVTIDGVETPRFELFEDAA